MKSTTRRGEGDRQAFSYYAGVPAEVMFRNHRPRFWSNPMTDEIRPNKQLDRLPPFGASAPASKRFDSTDLLVSENEIASQLANTLGVSIGCVNSENRDKLYYRE
jgi:hypothetical protein